MTKDKRFTVTRAEIITARRLERRELRGTAWHEAVEDFGKEKFDAVVIADRDTEAHDRTYWDVKVAAEEMIKFWYDYEQDVSESAKEYAAQLS